MRTTHYIYIPGLGDHVDPVRRFMLRRWERPGIKVTPVSMSWENQPEVFEKKYERIAEIIKRSKGEDIVLVG